MLERVALAWLLVVGVGTSPAVAQAYRFTRIVDSSTAVPGGSGDFVWLWEPAFDGTRIAFRGGETFSSTGVYVYDLTDGSLDVVYDGRSSVPGVSGSVRPVDGLQIDDGVVVFRGNADYHWSVFAYRAGALQLATGPSYGWTSDVSLQDGELAFTTDRAFVGPVGGPYTLVAARGDAAIGGSGVLEQIFGVRTDVREMYLWAWSGGGDGIFRCHPSGTWELMYHGSDFGPLNPPDQEFFLVQLDAEDGQFGFFVAESGSDVLYPSYTGLHTVRRGILEETLATGMTVPGRMEVFDRTGGSYSMDGAHVAALAGTASYGGLFTTLSGSLEEVLGSDDRLEGKSVDYPSIGVDALEGNALVFLVVFEDGSRAIYLAEWLGGGAVQRGQNARRRPLRRPRGRQCGVGGSTKTHTPRRVGRKR